MSEKDDIWSMIWTNLSMIWTNLFWTYISCSLFQACVCICVPVTGVRYNSLHVKHSDLTWPVNNRKLPVTGIVHPTIVTCHLKPYNLSNWYWQILFYLKHLFFNETPPWQNHFFVIILGKNKQCWTPRERFYTLNAQTIGLKQTKHGKACKQICWRIWGH